VDFISDDLLSSVESSKLVKLAGNGCNLALMGTSFLCGMLSAVPLPQEELLLATEVGIFTDQLYI
jgi:hypothetical protein